jgi:hypothetical protein
MDPRDTRWTVAALAAAGLFIGGGIGGAALDAAPVASEAAGTLPAHVHAATDTPSALTPIFAIADGAVIAGAPGPAAITSDTPIARVDFQNAMRQLWEDHIAWTRLYIVSFAADLPDQEATAQRLLRNQADIGNAVKPFYGEEAGNALTKLLEEHILDAADLLKAAKAGDQSAVDVASANWYANANAIAAFLHEANPDAWPLAELQTEMKAHLDITLEEATARLNGDYAADIAAYDEVETHILHLADLLSAGIMAQFPDRFA